MPGVQHNSISMYSMHAHSQSLVSFQCHVFDSLYPICPVPIPQVNFRLKQHCFPFALSPKKHNTGGIVVVITLFRERGREGEREGEKHQCVVAPHVRPTGGPGPQPRHVP